MMEHIHALHSGDLGSLALGMGWGGGLKGKKKIISFHLSRNSHSFDGSALVNEVICGVPDWGPKSGWSLRRATLRSLYLWPEPVPAAGPKAAHRVHSAHFFISHLSALL